MSRGGPSGVTMVDVVVTFLELDLATSAVAPARDPVPLPGREAVVLELDRIPPTEAGEVASTMYRAVGAAWHWTDRLPWSAAEWNQAVDRADVEVWVARVDHDIAGYFEIQQQDHAIELKYFGLMPEFTGRRIGGALLSAVIDRARVRLGTGRLTVNTCTLDHPAALPNYLKRGFIVVRTETQRRTLPQ